MGPQAPLAARVSIQGEMPSPFPTGVLQRGDEGLARDPLWQASQVGDGWQRVQGLRVVLLRSPGCVPALQGSILRPTRQCLRQQLPAERGDVGRLTSRAEHGHVCVRPPTRILHLYQGADVHLCASSEDGPPWGIAAV